MEVRLKEGIVRNYKFTNRKYSKMIYKNELKESSLRAEANYKVEALNSNVIKINCIEDKIESDDRLSILLGESNEIFKEMIFRLDELGVMTTFVNKEAMLGKIKRFRETNPEKYRFKVEKDFLISISNAYEEGLKQLNFEERFLDSGIIGVMFSGIYGNYEETIRKLKRNLRGMFTVPLAIEIHQNISRHMGNNEVLLEINGFLDNVYLKDFDIHDIMEKHLGYPRSRIDLTYRGNYKLELDTGFIKTANLIKKFKYGDDHIVELHSELIQNG